VRHDLGRRQRLTARTERTLIAADDPGVLEHEIVRSLLPVGRDDDPAAGDRILAQLRHGGGRWSLVVGHWSLLLGRWALVFCRWSLVMVRRRRTRSGELRRWVCRPRNESRRRRSGRGGRSDDVAWCSRARAR